MNVAQAIGSALAAAGVRHLFGVVGSGNFEVTGALVAGGARFVATRQETAAAAAADGYARVTRGPGVATVHQGPGFTNAITGMAEAAKAGTGVLLLAADTPASWVHSNFRIDQAGAADAAGIAVERLTSPLTAAGELARAWRRVAVDRQATVLLMPLDVQHAESPDLAVPAAAPRDPAQPDGEAVAAVAAMLAEARRPVIVAGRGAVVSDAGAAITRLAEKAGALLATSLGGHGLFSGSPFTLGISGGFATDLAVELISGADLLVAFGASLNRWTMRHGRMRGADTRLVQVEIDPARIGIHEPVEPGVVGDARATAEAITAAMAAAPRTGLGYRTPEIAERIATGGWAAQPFVERSPAGLLDPRRLSRDLDRLLPAERTVVLDGGHFSGWAAMYLSVPDADGFVPNQSFQAIGLGLGSAIGAAVARPGRLTVLAVGDGGGLMAAGELETAARIGLPMVICVYDDDAYGAEVHHFGPDGHSLDTVRFPPVDFAALGRAAGADGLTVRSSDDLAAVERWLSDPPSRPLVIDARIDPTVVGEWLPEAFRG